MTNEAMHLFDRGKYKEAQEYQLKVLKEREQLLG